jgi:hypothetical protein
MEISYWSIFQYYFLKEIYVSQTIIETIIVWKEHQDPHQSNTRSPLIQESVTRNKWVIDRIKSDFNLEKKSTWHHT